jgi:hypothetical protein
LLTQKEVTENVKEEAKSGQGACKWFPHAKTKNLNKTLDTIKSLWQAVAAGEEIAGRDSKEHKMFQEAGAWLDDKW